MTKSEIKKLCYDKFGSFSQLSLKILSKLQQFSNIHKLCEELGISYKFVKDVLQELAFLDGENYSVKPNLDLNNIYTVISLSEIETYEKEIFDITSKFTLHNKNLDHVSAVSQTLLKRVEYIYNNNDVENSKILFLGDHDFTSIALAYILKKLKIKNYTISVVDIDDNILNFISKVSVQYELNIKVFHSDFRIGVPTAYEKQFDLIFSDPPYTPEGMSLFLKRAIECAKDKNSSIYLCYKTAELSPAIGLKVQRELLKQKIYFRSILPDFNKYVGAEALGYRSDLYVCSLTPKSFEENDVDKNYDIYTHGNNSIEVANKVKIDYDEIINKLSDKLSCEQNLIKIISYKRYNSDNFVLIDTFYKQKRNKNANYPKESVFVFDFTYQNADVISLRNFIMSDKKQQFGIFVNNQIKVLKDSKYSAILSLYDISVVYKNETYCVVMFQLKDEVLLSTKSVMLYKNSNIKNAYVNVITKLKNITKNQAREEFANCPISNYEDAFIFDLPFYLMEIFCQYLQK